MKNKLKKLLIFSSLSFTSCGSIVKEAPVQYLYQFMMRPTVGCYRQKIVSQDPLYFVPDREVDISECNGVIGIGTSDQPSAAIWIKYSQKKIREKLSECK